MSLLDLLFSCSHENRSFPITDRSSGDTYTCCLECGTEHHYDWVTMSRRSERKRSAIPVDSLSLARPRRALAQMDAVSIGG